MSRVIPLTVRKHYESAPQSHRKTMLEMRKRILEIVPKAEEVVSYGMPAFKLDGNIIAGLLSNKNHIGYYPFSGSVLHLFEKELANFKTTKSALHIPVDKPLSKPLLTKLIKARISQCPVKQGKVDVSKYAVLDGFWREIGLAAPARRGLVDQKILNLSHLKKLTEKELAAIHGMGPSALAAIKKAMRKAEVTFKKATL